MKVLREAIIEVDTYCHNFISGVGCPGFDCDSAGNCCKSSPGSCCDVGTCCQALPGYPGTCC